MLHLRKPEITLIVMWMLTIENTEGFIKSKGEPSNSIDPESSQELYAKAALADKLEYKRYLDEIVGTLQQDEKFLRRVENATMEYQMEGEVANDLMFASLKIRKKLDEFKRRELERLRKAVGHNRKGIRYLEVRNPHTFEPEDLKKLLLHSRQRIEEMDKERKENFKRYELEKELQYRARLDHLSAEDRKHVETMHAEMQEKHQKHDKMNLPGSARQIKEVWEKMDGQDGDNLNLRTFFFLHDLNGDAVWDGDEVKTLFKIELDKYYQEGDDLVERHEEMERMKEYFFQTADTDRDMVIDIAEMTIAYKKRIAEGDKNWEPMDSKSNPTFTQDEYKDYEKKHKGEQHKYAELRGLSG